MDEDMLVNEAKKEKKWEEKENQMLIMHQSPP